MILTCMNGWVWMSCSNGCKDSSFQASDIIRSGKCTETFALLNLCKLKHVGAQAFFEGHRTNVDDKIAFFDFAGVF